MQLILCVWPELPLDQQYTVARLSNYITTNNARICVCFAAMPFRMSPSLVAPAGGAHGVMQPKSVRPQNKQVFF